MHRSDTNKETGFHELTQRAYEPTHIAKVREDIRHHFDHYFNSMGDSAWKASVKFVGALNTFEDERQPYLRFLDQEALEEYDDDPNAFKKAIRKECPIVRHCMNSSAKVMESYQSAFWTTPGARMLEVTRNIVEFGAAYAAQFNVESFLQAETPMDFGVSGLDDEPYTAYGVIGGGIRTLFLYYLWPHAFPNRSQAGIWALYFLTGRNNYGFHDDSEFLMIQDDGTQQNYFYPYDLFTFYARDLLLLIQSKSKAAGFSINPDQRFVYVNCFLQHVADTHATDINILKPPSERHD